MAEIPVRRKRHLWWLWALLALIVAVLLLWWLMDDDDDEVATLAEPPVATAPPGVAIAPPGATVSEPQAPDITSPAPDVATVAGAEAASPATPGGALQRPPSATLARSSPTIADVVANPATYVGRNDFAAEVDVPSVPTDRGFWVQAGGQRLFALIIDEPREVPLDINAGQRLRVRNGMLRDKSFLGQIPGVPITAATRRILDQQRVFLIVDEDDIEILSRR